jgi:hypothetical protein
VDLPTLDDDLAHAAPRPREVVARIALAIRGHSRAPFDLVSYSAAVASMSLGHPLDVGAIAFILGLTAARIGGARRWARRLARDGALVPAAIETFGAPGPRTIARFDLDGARRVATLTRGRTAAGQGTGHALVAPGVRYAWILGAGGATLAAIDPIAIPRAELRRA